MSKRGIKLEETKGKRLNDLDVLKVICAFLVICIHISYKGNLGNTITPLCRIAVPIFFMIIGYFYYKTSKSPLKQIKKVLILIILANCLYFVFGIMINGQIELPTKEDIVKSLIFNSSPFAFHLWYLNALLYVLIIVYIADKLNIRKKMYFLIPVLLITNIIFGEYAIALFNKDYDPIYMRNFLFIGLPYFLIGDLLYKNKENLIKKFSIKKLTILIPIFALTTVLEEHILTINKMDAIGDIYISTTFLAIAIFLFSIQAKQVSDENKLAIIGRKYSTYIYIVHLVFIDIFNKYISSNNILNNSIQIIIFFASLLVAIIYVNFKNKILIAWKKCNNLIDLVKLLHISRESD